MTDVLLCFLCVGVWVCLYFVCVCLYVCVCICTCMCVFMSGGFSLFTLKYDHLNLVVYFGAL